jgi:hypothetical protein
MPASGPVPVKAVCNRAFPSCETTLRSTSDAFAPSKMIEPSGFAADLLRSEVAAHLVVRDDKGLHLVSREALNATAREVAAIAGLTTNTSLSTMPTAPISAMKAKARFPQTGPDRHAPNVTAGG